MKKCCESVLSIRGLLIAVLGCLLTSHAAPAQDDDNNDDGAGTASPVVSEERTEADGEDWIPGPLDNRILRKGFGTLSPEPYETDQRWPDSFRNADKAERMRRGDSGEREKEALRRERTRADSAREASKQRRTEAKTGARLGGKQEAVGAFPSREEFLGVSDLNTRSALRRMRREADMYYNRLARLERTKKALEKKGHTPVARRMDAIIALETFTYEQNIEALKGRDEQAAKLFEKHYQPPAEDEADIPGAPLERELGDIEEIRQRVENYFGLSETVRAEEQPAGAEDTAETEETSEPEPRIGVYGIVEPAREAEPAAEADESAADDGDGESAAPAAASEEDNQAEAPTPEQD